MTDSDTLIVELASVEDISEISEVLREAAIWMKELGQALWSADALGPEFVKPIVDANEFVVARLDERVVGVATLHWCDLEFWPDSDDNDAGYLHKIAIRRKVAGRGVPGRIIEWSARHAESLGKSYLRLDCDPRPKLYAVYERLGFNKLDVITVSSEGRSPFSVARWQRRIMT